MTEVGEFAGFGAIEYLEEGDHVVHAGFETNQEAAEWAAQHLPAGAWQLVTVRIRKLGV